MKKFKALTLAALVLAVCGVIGYATRGDLTTLVGQSGSTRGLELFRVSSSGEVLSYFGDLVLGAGGTRPSTTANAYPNVQVPFYNGSETALTEGAVIVSSGPFASTSLTMGSVVSAVSTTSTLGVCTGSVAAGAVGWMAVSGYAVVKVTGTVIPGDHLVSTTSLTSVGGFAGVMAPGTSVVAGTIIGKAVTRDSNNTVIALINAQ